MKKTGKAYYMISAVAQKYNIHPQTLRLYEREGLLKPSRTEGNTRLYSEEDLEQLETILSLTRDLGVNLAGVEIILNMRRKIEQMQHEVNEFMEYVKRELARGIDDWEQRLSTALVKSSPTDLVRTRRRQTKTQKSEESIAREAARHTLICSPGNLCHCDALPSLRRHRLEAGRRDTERVASCAATAGARRVGRSGSPKPTFRSAISTARSPISPPITSRSSKPSRRRAASPKRFRSVEPGTVPRRAARRRQDAPGGRRAEAGDRDLRRARAVLRHARTAARHPQHLRSVDSHDRARGPASGDARRPARARRSGRREDLRVGRRDDEPDRQHALQRAPPDDFHVELPGHPRRHRSELAAVPHRLPHAVAPARDVRVRR